MFYFTIRNIADQLFIMRKVFFATIITAEKRDSSFNVDLDHIMLM